MTAHSEWTHEVGAHCGTCGKPWPKDAGGICQSCKAGLPCRADTTDEVAPDPPCAGFRRAIREQTANA